MIRESFCFEYLAGRQYSQSLPVRQFQPSLLKVEVDAAAVEMVTVNVLGFDVLRASVSDIQWLMGHYDVMDVDDGFLLPIKEILKSCFSGMGRGYEGNIREFIARSAVSIRIDFKVDCKNGSGRMKVFDQPVNRVDPLTRLRGV